MLGNNTSGPVDESPDTPERSSCRDPTRKRKPGTPKKAAFRKAHGLFQDCDNARRVIHRNCGESTEMTKENDGLLDRLTAIAETKRQAMDAWGFYFRVGALGFDAVRESTSRSTFYRYRKLLNLAGVDDAMIKEGGKLPERPKPVFVQEWVPTAKTTAMLKQIEDAHSDAITDESAND